MLKRFHKFFSNDIGIDLGTANTLVYVCGKGVVINEPSIVAINQKTGRIVALGKEAKQMVGRTPAHIKIVKPLVEGVISDFEVTEEMLSYFIRKVKALAPGKFGRPRLLIGVPSGITSVERRAVRDAGINAGAREVLLVEEPIAAAIGIRLPVHEPVGSMIVDIGGGTTDIATIALNGVVRSKNLRIAGDRFNEDIISYVRDEFKILLGERTAETVKMSICAACEQTPLLEAPIRGRDLVTGLPREVIVTDCDIREAISSSLSILVSSIREVIELTPPEIVSDIMHKGLVLVGGGSLIHGLPELLKNELKISVHVAEDPLSAVVRGTGVILENLDLYKEVLIDDEDDLPPK